MGVAEKKLLRRFRFANFLDNLLSRGFASLAWALFIAALVVVLIAAFAYFTACTNCPLAAVALACEAFSLFGLGWYLLAAALAYALTFRVGFCANGDFYSGFLKNALAAAFQREGRA